MIILSTIMQMEHKRCSASLVQRKQVKRLISFKECPKVIEKWKSTRNDWYDDKRYEGSGHDVESVNENSTRGRRKYGA